MSQTRNARILATGSFLPPQCMTAVQLNQRLGKPSGWVEQHMGIEQRHFAAGESTVQMAVQAARVAWSGSPGAIDCIISAASVPEQAIPTTSVLVQEALGLNGITAFDVNSTCLSFLSALDIAFNFIHMGSHKRVLIVSAEMPSLALDWSNAETSALFGDGAGAMIVGPSPHPETSCCLGSLMRTFPRGARYCEVRSSGTAHQAAGAPNDDAHLFRMQGPLAYRLAAEELPPLFADLLDQVQLSLGDIKLFVPHQASHASMRYMAARLGLASEKIVDIFARQGNQVAASLPSAFHHAEVSGLMKRGDHVMLLGSAAGISVGAMVLKY